MSVATVAAIVKKKGKILLEKRAIEPFKGYWCLPGGHIKLGEEAEKAIKREVKEETGLKVKKVKFLFYQDEIIPRIRWHAVVLVFICEVSGKEKPQKAEVERIEWFTPQEALKLKLAFAHRKILKRFLSLTAK